jgi:hypothetical protein
LKSRILDTENPSSNVSALAESLYKLNHHQAIEFEINAITKIADFLPELYPYAPPDESKKMREILNIWLLAKFCHYAENVAAYALSFLISYEDERDEIQGVFKKIIKYNMGEITDFYTHIDKRDDAYIAEFLGYPSVELQNDVTKQILRESCGTIKELMSKIATNYKELYGFYSAYKHGYRVMSGHLDGSIDIMAYVGGDGEQYYFEVYNNDIQEIRKLSRDCSSILDCIFENHRQRTLRESIGSEYKVQIKTIMKDASNYKKENLSMLYPTRGERKKDEELQADRIYAELIGHDMETKHQGKIVAIDFDNVKIICMDYNPRVVIDRVHNRESSGRVRIRRVGKNKGTGIKIW